MNSSLFSAVLGCEVAPNGNCNVRITPVRPALSACTFVRELQVIIFQGTFFCFLFSFLLEFNLYSWWNVDLSVKGNWKRSTINNGTGELTSQVLSFSLPSQPKELAVRP